MNLKIALQFKFGDFLHSAIRILNTTAGTKAVPGEEGCAAFPGSLQKLLWQKSYELENGYNTARKIYARAKKARKGNFVYEI